MKPPRTAETLKWPDMAKGTDRASWSRPVGMGYNRSPGRWWAGAHTADEALNNVRDALAAVIETYQDLGRPLPSGIAQNVGNGPVWLETLVGSP